jgi:hypothetical protein
MYHGSKYRSGVAAVKPAGNAISVDMKIQECSYCCSANSPMNCSWRNPLTHLAFPLICALAGDSLRAATVNLTPVADTSMLESEPNNNLGNGATLLAGGRRQGGRTRALIQFDIASSIPAGSTITAVTLTLNVTQTPSGGISSTFDLNRVLAAWGEGAGSDHHGSVATAGQASWNNRLGPGTPWTTAGGDFSTTASASKGVAGNGAYTFASTASLVADVQSWRDTPASNFGWLLRSESETTPVTIRRFGNRSAGANAPVLTITYTPPPPPPPNMFAVGLVGNAFRFSFNAASNQAYAVDFRNSLAAANWSVLTNIPAQAADTTMDITNSISTAERYFRVRTTNGPVNATLGSALREGGVQRATLRTHAR